MNVILDDQFIRRVLIAETVPSWISDLVGEGTLYTTPRWKRRIEIAWENPRNGKLSTGISSAVFPLLLSRLRFIALTPAISGPLPESVDQIAALPPLWREAIVGAVLTESVLIVNPTAITDRNRDAIEAALQLLHVVLQVRPL